MTLGQSGKLFIANEWREPSGGLWDAVTNPATEEACGKVAVADLADVDAAIASARESFDKGPWSRMSIADRVTILDRLCDWLEQNGEAIRHLICLETGSVQPFLRTMQFATGIEHARHYLELARRIVPESLPLEPVARPDGTTMVGSGQVVHDPVGVVLAITPFNVPFTLNLGKAIPAMVMGNTVVLKPSPLTPFSALVIAEAAQAAGLPQGVLNVINTDMAGSELLTTDPRVDLITFTGSDRVGAAIQAQAAPTLKRCIMELGGKSAMIVREDGDIEAAANAALTSLTLHAGQACAALTRLVVHNKIRRRFVETLQAKFENVRIGDPMDPASRMGPVISAASLDRVEAMVASAIADGSRLVTGGERPRGMTKGYFYRPTLFDDVDNGSRIARDEVFGPVGVVIGFDTDDEAVAIANDSEFGLSGAVFSADVGKGYQLALAMRTGKVNLNGGSGKMSPYHPFGGIKRSGYGREFGEAGLLEFTASKTISFHLA